MSVKHGATQQHVYASTRPQLKKTIQPTKCTGDHGHAVSTLKRTRCPMQHQQSQSITALQNIDLYGSYSTLPMAVGTPRAPTPCARHGTSRWYPQQDEYCCSFSINHNTPLPNFCICGSRRAIDADSNSTYQQYQRRPLHPSALRDETRKSLRNGCYFGYDHATTDEEDSAFPGLPDQEFHLLHRNIPALRRTGMDTSGIRQYFYPDGGWGWIICGISFLVHILTTGLQLSYGLLLFYAVHHLPNSAGIEWLGALSWSISALATPFVVTVCRKKSTRLLAVVGGLVLPLGMLFTSFATELGQVVFSYGILFAVGVSMVRESSTIMLGNYFKRRRQFVEMIAMSGEGVGIALFSVILKEGVGKAGWRFGLQIISAIVSISFFMGLLYRPASLYHPQRRAIQHLKNQRRKLQMREHKMTSNVKVEASKKYFFLDISSLKSTTVKILLMTSAVAALGIYTPMFLMSLNAAGEGSDTQDLVLLQTFLGMSSVFGVFLSGALVRRPIRIGRFVVTTQIVSQVFISTVAIAILLLSFVMGYTGMCVLSWIYGIGLGGFRYSFKILALERVKLKQFSKAWGLIRGVESIPVLISVPLTSFLNDYSLKYGRAGYYICSAAAAIAAIIIFFISHTNLQQNTNHSALQRKQTNGFIPTLRAGAAHHCKSNFIPPPPPPTTDFVYNGCDYPAPDLLNRSCISLSQVENEQAYRGVCCGLGPFRMQCLHHRVPYDALEQRLEQRRRAEQRVAAEANIERQYNFGQGSVGSRMGKRLQKSLSFIHNPYACEEQWYCTCPAGSNYHWTASRQRLAETQQLHCTCSPTSAYLQNSRSHSVPEGLASMSQHCLCKPLPSREIIYVPRQLSRSRELAPCRVHPHQVEGTRLPTSTPAGTPHYRRQRSQSLSKPFQFLEQITTSV